MTGGTETASSSRISGVVEGTVSASVDAEGEVTVHIRIGAPGRGDRIEVVLRREDAESLGGLLSGGPERARPWVFVPCFVGARLGLYAP